MAKYFSSKGGLYILRKGESRYLFFADFKLFYSPGELKLENETRKQEKLLEKFIERTRKKISRLIAEDKKCEVEIVVSKIFNALGKTKNKIIFQIINKLICGDNAKGIAKVLIPEVHKLCILREEKFCIDLMVELIHLLNAEECDEILTPIIQKLFEKKVLPESAINGIKMIDDEEWEIADDFIVETSSDGKTIAFEFDEKGKILMIPPDSLPKF